MGKIRENDDRIGFWHRIVRDFHWQPVFIWESDDVSWYLDLGMELGILTMHNLTMFLWKKDDKICYWILLCSFFTRFADKWKLWKPWTIMRIGAGLVCPESILNHFVHVLTCLDMLNMHFLFQLFLRTSWKLPKTSASAHAFSAAGMTVSLKPRTLRPEGVFHSCGAEVRAWKSSL